MLVLCVSAQVGCSSEIVLSSSLRLHLPSSLFLIRPPIPAPYSPSPGSWNESPANGTISPVSYCSPFILQMHLREQKNPLSPFSFFSPPRHAFLSPISLSLLFLSLLSLSFFRSFLPSLSLISFHLHTGSIHASFDVFNRPDFCVSTIANYNFAPRGLDHCLFRVVFCR